MRAMSKGKPFMHVEAEWLPDTTVYGEDGELKKVPAEPGPCPVFSEHFLYETVGKDDARFILGVAEEYEHLIALLGTDRVCELLAMTPGEGVAITVTRTTTV